MAESSAETSEEQGSTPPRRAWACPCFRILFKGILALAFAGMILWGTLAIAYSNLPPRMRPAAAGAFAVLSSLYLIATRRRANAWLGFVAAFAALLGWWLAIPPSNSRDWQRDVAVLPYADIEPDRVTIHNIRNCDYRSETDFDVRHYDRTFDLRKISSIDFYVVHWGSPSIAHTMLSFGFEPGQYVCFSIETRKEKGEDYSTVKGFFKQYELTYVVADERDLVRLRTNYRNEEVYLYRLQTTPDVMRQVFLDYLKTVNSLKAKAEWYNALTSNCTTNIRGHTAPYAGKKRLDWRLIINGYVDEMAYDNDKLDRSLPFDQLKVRSLINKSALAAGSDPDFSRRIREGLPGMVP